MGSSRSTSKWIPPLNQQISRQPASALTPVSAQGSAPKVLTKVYPSNHFQFMTQGKVHRKKRRRKNDKCQFQVGRCKPKMLKCQFSLSFFLFSTVFPATYMGKRKKNVGFYCRQVGVRAKLTSVSFFFFFSSMNLSLMIIL